MWGFVDPGSSVTKKNRRMELWWFVVGISIFIVLLRLNYLSTLLSHKTWNKHSVSRLFYLFAQLDLLSLTLSFLCSSFFFVSMLWLFPPMLRHPSMLLEVKPFNFPRQFLTNVEEGDVENSGEFWLLELLCCDPLGYSLRMTLAKASSRSLQVDVADSP